MTKLKHQKRYIQFDVIFHDFEVPTAD